MLFSPGFHAMRPSINFPIVPAVYDSQYIEFGSCTFCGCYAYEPCKHEMKEMEYYSSSDTTLLDFLLGRKCFDYNEVNHSLRLCLGQLVPLLYPVCSAL